MPDGKRFPMEMEVLGITRPIVSVPMRWKTARQGFHFQTEEEPEAYMAWEGRKYPLLEERNSYYLVLRLVRQRLMTTVVLQTLLDAPDGKWCIVEWRCSETSFLATAFEKRGHRAIRL